MRSHVVAAAGNVARVTPVDDEPLTCLGCLPEGDKGADNGGAPDWVTLFAGSPLDVVGHGLMSVILPVPAWDMHTLRWWREQATLHLDSLMVTLGRRRTAKIEVLHQPGYVLARVSTRSVR